MDAPAAAGVVDGFGVTAPFLSDPDLTLYVGDARTVLAELADGSVDCVVTSPPYWGLRDYGTGEWEGGDPDCEHLVREDARVESSTLGGGKATTGHQREGFKDICGRCGARRVDLQIGLEQTPDEYVAAIVSVFREVHRVLAPYGTLWLNLGDTYASAWACDRRNVVGSGSLAHGKRDDRPNRLVGGLKEKDLVGIPWRVALALQADGWWLRNDNIWSKPNPMPESVTDRATMSHEYVFMLTKSGTSQYWTHDLDGRLAAKQPAADYWWFPPPGVEGDPSRVEVAGWRRRNVWRGHDYWYDAEAVREANVSPEQAAHTTKYAKVYDSHTERVQEGKGVQPGNVTVGRNARSVWEIATHPFPAAHFAVFPPKLARRCIVAGCPTQVCRVCGKPRERIVERGAPELQADTWSANGAAAYDDETGGYADAGSTSTLKHIVPTTTVGWTDCGHDDYRPGRVFDPFGGAGTVAVVAREQQRHAVLIELNPEYAEIISRRLAQQSLFAEEA